MPNEYHLALIHKHGRDRSGHTGRHSYRSRRCVDRDFFNQPDGCARLDILRDDGAVVYLNGVEVARSNMPDGTIGPQTVADGLKVPLKELTWHFVSNHVSDILLATEEEIVAAMYLAWQRMKIVMEPSCAVPLATLLKNKKTFAGKRVGVIITGGNVDLKHCPGCK